MLRPELVFLQLGLLIVAAVAAAVISHTARNRFANADMGGFWVTIVERIAIFLGLTVIVSHVVHGLLPDWSLLEADQSRPELFLILLAVPFLAWAAMIVIGLATSPASPQEARWFAGFIGFHARRWWVLSFAAILLVGLLSVMPQLGGGHGAYPAVTWGTGVVAIASLIGIALTNQSADAAVEAPAAKAGAQLLPPPWPAAMHESGMQVAKVASWATATQPQAEMASRTRIGDFLCLRGAQRIAPDLLHAMDRLIEPVRAREHEVPGWLVLAPDQCGQVEAVAAATTLLAQRFGERSLVVTARNADRWLAAAEPWAGRATLAQPSTKEDPSPAWVVDSEILSDRVLQWLTDPALAAQFGLVVWWDIHEHSGILGANMWAVSRRLHRILQRSGRAVRSVAFTRTLTFGHAQLPAFARDLLPHTFPEENQVNVQPHIATPVHLYSLEDHAEVFQQPQPPNIPETARHAGLIAALLSERAGWPTRVDSSSDATAMEHNAVLQVSVNGTSLRDRLEKHARSSAVRITELREADVLAISDVVSHSGNAAPPGLSAYVALPAPHNPYVRHLLRQLSEVSADYPRMPAARRLVCANRNPDLVQRHVLLALAEAPDTKTNLLSQLRWDESIVRGTLEKMAQAHRLMRREVRWIDDTGRLHPPDYRYTSLYQPVDARRSLDSVGEQLIEVRETATGGSAGGVRMRVDPERLPIQAYPKRVFTSAGQRYEILDWSADEGRLTHLKCELQSRYSRTWRIHIPPKIKQPTSTHPPQGIHAGGAYLTRYIAKMVYEESVVSTLVVTPDLTTGRMDVRKEAFDSLSVTAKMPTVGLLLHIPDAGPNELVSLSHALRYVVPVHVGVDDDAVQIVAVEHLRVSAGDIISGLAIVDLYPNGIGLIDALGNDNALLLDLLKYTRNWLALCRCNSDEGCASCLRTPLGEALSRYGLITRAAALRILDRVVGEAP